MLRMVRPVLAVALLGLAVPAFATTAAPQAQRAVEEVDGEPRGAERLYPISTLSIDSWRTLARVTRIDAERDESQTAPARAEASATSNG